MKPCRKVWPIYNYMKIIKEVKEFAKTLSTDFIATKISTSKTRAFFFCLVLSWIYALCSQVIIPLPFNLVPLSLQPLPLFLATLAFGWYGVYAFWLYFIQGALGLPFYAGFSGGFASVFSPTGGYRIGFGLALTFIAFTNNITDKGGIFLRLLVSCMIYFACGILMLTLYVPTESVLSIGLYPFLIGDWLKLLIAWAFAKNSN